MTLHHAEGLVFSYSEALMVVGSCCVGYVNLLYYALAKRMLISNTKEYRKYLYKDIV